jgi:hypothetical protein
MLFYTKRLTPGITRRPTRLLEHESRRVGGRVHAVPMQSQETGDDTTPSQAHEQPQFGRADLLPRALVVMRESVSGVPPRSYSGSESHSMIRARAYGQVTLLAGLGSEELAHNGIRPSPYLPHAFSEA